MPSAITVCFAIGVLVSEIEMYLCAPEINRFRKGIKSKRPLLNIESLADKYAVQWIESGVDFSDIPWRVAFDAEKSGELYMKDEYIRAIVQRNELAGYKSICTYKLPVILEKFTEMLISVNYMCMNIAECRHALTFIHHEIAPFMRYRKGYVNALFEGLRRIECIARIRGDFTTVCTLQYYAYKAHTANLRYY